MPRVPATPADETDVQYDERELRRISIRLRLDAIGKQPWCDGKSHQSKAAATQRVALREVRGKAP